MWSSISESATADITMHVGICLGVSFTHETSLESNQTRCSSARVAQSSAGFTVWVSSVWLLPSSSEGEVGR